PSVTATNAARPKNRNVVFTIAFWTALGSLRSYRVKTSYLLDRYWPTHRVNSLDRFRRNNTATDARGLSLPSLRLNLNPSRRAQTGGLYETAAGSLVTIQMLPTRVRFAFPNRRAVDRSRARCRGYPSQAGKNRSLSKEDRDLSD